MIFIDFIFRPNLPCTTNTANNTENHNIKTHFKTISIFQCSSFRFGIFDSRLESWFSHQTSEVDIFVQRTLLRAAADGEDGGEGDVDDDEDDDDDEIGVAGGGGEAAASGAAGGGISRILQARALVKLLQTKYP